MTSFEKISIHWQRIGLGATAREGIFQAHTEGGHLTAIVTRDQGRWHLSISHRLNVADPTGKMIPGRLPTYEELKAARYDLLPDEVTVGMLFPPVAEFVNLHPTTLHLWEVR